IGAGVFFAMWSVMRALCRKLGLARRYQILIPSGIFALPLLFWLAAGIDRLGPLERTCRDALVKTRRMDGTTALRIEAHYDFWTKTNSGGGWVSPWISRPYETPRVLLMINFERDHRPHAATIACIFARMPNTGDPPLLAMQEVRFENENVLE